MGGYDTDGIGGVLGIGASNNAGTDGTACVGEWGMTWWWLSDAPACDAAATRLAQLERSRDWAATSPPMALPRPVVPATVPVARRQAPRPWSGRNYHRSSV